MKDPVICNLVKLVPHVEEVIAGQRERAFTLPAEKRRKLLRQLAQLERKVESVRQYDKE